MELYQLKTFVTVADEGNLTRAAQRLHISQPAVSAHVKALESELGVNLFERTPKGMRLTGDGEVLKAQAERALAEVEGILEQGLPEHLFEMLEIGLPKARDQDGVERLVVGEKDAFSPVDSQEVRVPLPEWGGSLGRPGEFSLQFRL